MAIPITTITAVFGAATGSISLLWQAGKTCWDWRERHLDQLTIVTRAVSEAPEFSTVDITFTPRRVREGLSVVIHAPRNGGEGFVAKEEVFAVDNRGLLEFDVLGAHAFMRGRLKVPMSISQDHRTFSASLVAYLGSDSGGRIKLSIRSSDRVIFRQAQRISPLA